MTLRILAVGDVVGQAGLAHLRATLHQQKQALGVDLCIVNGENASEIKGICRADAEVLLYAGADLITLGNHTYSAPDTGAFLDERPDVIIRPANYPASNPGYGYTIVNAAGARVLCINLLGCVHMDPLDNPFLTLERILDAQKGQYDVAVLDMHAEATSEKYAIARAFDGKRYRRGIARRKRGVARFFGRVYRKYLLISQYLQANPDDAPLFAPCFYFGM